MRTTLRRLRRSRRPGLAALTALTAAVLLATVAAAAPPPPSGGGLPAGQTPDSQAAISDAQQGAVADAREAAYLLALSAFPVGSGASDLGATVDGLGLVTASGRPAQVSALDAADTAGAPLLAALTGTGVRVGKEVPDTLGLLSPADRAAVAAGRTISIAPSTYLSALDDLVNRDGRPNIQGTPVNPQQIQAALRNLLGQVPTTGTPAASPSATGTTVPDGLTPAAATGGPVTTWIAIAVLAVLLLLAALLWALRRRSPAAAVAPQNVASLLDVSRRLTALAPGADLPRAIVREAIGLVGADGAALLVRDDGGLAVGHESTPSMIVTDGFDRGAVERVAATGQPVIQVSATEPSLRNLPAALAVVPLVSGGRVAAVLLLTRDPGRPFTPAERDLLMALSPVAAAAMDAAQRAGTAIEQSLTDPLTGIGNRRRLDEELPALLAKGHEPVAVAMVDLDHFKSVNDTHGHAAGDAVLRAVAATLRDTVRPGDRVYRFGGEEFCVVLPSASVEEAASVAERVRAAVAAKRISLSSGQELTATASLGVAAANGSAPAALAAADAALYRAKEAGRNRVERA